MIPIPLPEFDATQWRSLEKQLMVIAAKEKLQLKPRDRKVNNILATVQHSARAKRWHEVFNMLCERGIITLQSTTPQVKVTKPKPVRTKPKSIKISPVVCFFVVRTVFNWIASYRLSPLYFQLTYRNEHGYYKLKSKLKMGATVRRMLILSRKHHKKAKAKRLSTIAKSELLTKAFDKILTDQWQDVKTLYEKFCKVTDIPMERSRFDDRLEYRAKKGEIFKHKPNGSNCAFYSTNPDASSFGDEWMDLNRAYAVAVANGCKAAINTFRSKATRKDYTKQGVINYYRQFGLEYRFEVPSDQNKFFKWRLVN